MHEAQRAWPSRCSSRVPECGHVERCSSTAHGRAGRQQCSARALTVARFSALPAASASQPEERHGLDHQPARVGRRGGGGTARRLRPGQRRERCADQVQPHARRARGSGREGRPWDTTPATPAAAAAATADRSPTMPPVACAGTGRTGYLAVPPNNYPFYSEGEKYVPVMQADGGQLSGARGRRAGCHGAGAPAAAACVIPSPAHTG